MLTQRVLPRTVRQDERGFLQHSCGCATSAEVFDRGQPVFLSGGHRRGEQCRPVGHPDDSKTHSFPRGDGSTVAAVRPKAVERDGRLVVIRDVPVEVCDACGEAYLDVAVAKQLDVLLRQMLESPVDEGCRALRFGSCIAAWLSSPQTLSPSDTHARADR